MKFLTGIIGIIIVGMLCGCAWVDKNAPWLGGKSNDKNKPVPVTPAEHESVLRPDDGLVVKETPEPKPKPEPATKPTPKPKPRPKPKPVPKPKPKKVPDPFISKMASVAESRPAAVKVDTKDESSQEVVAASMVQVNGSFITIDDILQEVGPKLGRIPADISQPTLRRQVSGIISDQVRRRIIQLLVLEQADRRLTDQQKEHIDNIMGDTLRQMVAQEGGSRKKLEQKFIDESTTLNAVMVRHRKEATARLFLQTMFVPNISVTRKELWNFYNSHRADYVTPKKVQMQIISVPLSEFLPKDLPAGGKPTEMELQAARKRACDVIDKAIEALQAGTDMGQVAKRFSRGIKADKGGLWDLMPKGSFKAERIESIAFKLKDGQMAGPIKTTDGYYIVKAKRVQEGKSITFADAQEDIDRRLRDKQFEKLTDEYFQEILKDATIVQSPMFMEMAVDRAVKTAGM